MATSCSLSGGRKRRKGTGKRKSRKTFKMFRHTGNYLNRVGADFNMYGNQFMKRARKSRKHLFGFR